MDGQLLPIEAPVLRVDDSAFLEGRGCYSSARVVRGDVRFASRHAQRLVRGAAGLGLGELDEAYCLRALHELARDAFPASEGAVRLQVTRDGAGTHLVGIPRALGPEPPEWSAIVAPFPHPGCLPCRGVKLSNRLAQSVAAQAAAHAGAEEALLFDAGGRLVEGARTCLLVVTSDGEPRIPPLERGGVQGIAWEVVLERHPEIREADVSARELGAARELVALNAVRGAVPITRVDGRLLGDGRPGSWAARAAQALAEAD